MPVMARLPRVLPAVALVVAIAIATGCGSGGDPVAYVDQMNTTQTAFSKAFKKVQAENKPGASAAVNRQALGRFGTTLTRTTAAFREIKPPDSVKQLHDELIAEVDRYRAAIAKAESQFASNSPQQIVAAQTALSTSVATTAARINATITKINDKLH